MKDNDELIKRDFLLEVPHLKGCVCVCVYVWTCVEGNAVGKRRSTKQL